MLLTFVLITMALLALALSAKNPLTGDIEHGPSVAILRAALLREAHLTSSVDVAYHARVVRSELRDSP